MALIIPPPKIHFAQVTATTQSIASGAPSKTITWDHLYTDNNAIFSTTTNTAGDTNILLATGIAGVLYWALQARVQGPGAFGFWAELQSTGVAPARGPAFWPQASGANEYANITTPVAGGPALQSVTTGFGWVSSTQGQVKLFVNVFHNAGVNKNVDVQVQLMFVNRPRTMITVY